MSKVLLVGNYGVGNVGDDLLREGALGQLDKLGAEVVVCGPGKDCDTPLPPAGVRSLFSLNIFKFWKSLWSTDYVVFGGGGLLNPEESRSLFIWGHVIMWAFIFRRPAYMIGQSFSSVNSVVKFLLNKVEKVSVRDELSYNLLIEAGFYNVVRSYDLAWSLKVAKVSDLKENVVGLNIRKYDSIEDAYMKDILVVLMSEFKRLGLKKIRFLNFDKNDGDYFDSLIGGELELEVKYIDDKKEDLIKAMSECELVVTERLHAGIMAVKLGLKVVPLSYSSKVKSMFEGLGCDWLVNLRSNFDGIALEKAKVLKKPQPELDEVLVELLG